MAQQLLQDRTPAGYAGVEAYARKHAKEDAGALAWLVVGYAHTLDHDYGKAIDPLNRSKSGASELGDYVAYLLGDAYLQTGRNAEALAMLSDFDKNFPNAQWEILPPPKGPDGASADGVEMKDARIYAISRKADDAGKGPAIAKLLEWMLAGQPK